MEMDGACPGADSNDVLILLGIGTFGRTGNNLIEFLHALQYARDPDVQLAIKYDSWVIRLVHDMWLSRMSGEFSGWEARFEKAFCVKIFHHMVQPMVCMKKTIQPS